MGNKPFHMAVKVDQPTCQAGTKISGKVYVSVNKKNCRDIGNVHGIFLILEGIEQISVVNSSRKLSETKQSNGKEGSSKKEVNCHVVRLKTPLVDYGKKPLRPGQYEYPFEWDLPDHLPSSLHCKHKDGSSVAEIRYTLTAYLSTCDVAPTTTLSEYHQSSCILRVTAARGDPKCIMNKAMYVHKPEVFPVYHCFFNKGSIGLGFDVDKLVVSPTEQVTVKVRGENNSRLDISCIHVKWTEKVTFKLPDAKNKEFTRVLAEQKYVLHDLAHWQSLYQPKNTKGQQLGHSRDEPPINVILVLPPDARNTYSGPLIQVRHLLSVEAITEGTPILSTVPQLIVQAYVVPIDASSTDQENAVQTASVTGAYTLNPNYDPQSVIEAQLSQRDILQQHATIQADVLPDDWHPSTAPVANLPQAQVIMIDNDDVVNPFSLADAKIIPTTSRVASAPQEDLLHFDDSAEIMSENGQASVAKLLQLIQECSENVSIILANQDDNDTSSIDPDWVNAIRSMTPIDLVQAISGADPRHVASIATILANQMGQMLECRHVLACLYALPSSNEKRIAVVEILAPKASDLTLHESLIERELTSQEKTMFRTALKLR